MAVVDFARAYYELAFRNRFLELDGNTFQDFFSTLMEKRYPAGDFVRVRPWGNIGDRKNDGYLRSERKLFQVYAPSAVMKLAKLVEKIEEDFGGALPYWKKYFDEWILVHNDKDGLPPDALALLLKLSNSHQPLTAKHWGYEDLLREFRKLSGDDMASLVGAGPTMTDMISFRVQEVQNLLQHIMVQPEPPPTDVRPVPADKLQHNMLSDGTATLLKAGMARADVVQRYLRGLADPTHYDKVAAAFRRRYDELRKSGYPPDDIFAGLQRFVAGDQVPSPKEQAATVAILAYFFEACEIFERPQERGGDRA